jgi:hypothetical protein
VQHTCRVSQERAHGLEVLGLFVADAHDALGRELIYPRVRIRHQNTEIDAEKGELLKATVRAQTRILLEQWSKEGLANARESSGRKKPVARAVAKKPTARKSTTASAKK